MNNHKQSDDDCLDPVNKQAEGVGYHKQTAHDRVIVRMLVCVRQGTVEQGFKHQNSTLCRSIHLTNILFGTLNMKETSNLTKCLLVFVP